MNHLRLFQAKINILKKIFRMHGGKIYPCAGKKWNECFTEWMGSLYFWYNDENDSTHAEMVLIC
jgi:hypothetical protein